MPVYQHECQECGYVFDKEYSIKETKIPNCPMCKGKSERLISGNMCMLFKGEGFYVNDYGDSTRKKTPQQKAAEEK